MKKFSPLFLLLLSFLQNLSAQNLDFQKTFTIGNASTSAESIIKTNDNGVAIAGVTTVNGNGESFLTKINNDGSIAWTKIYYDGQSHIFIQDINDTEIFCRPIPRFMIQTSDNGFLIGGGIDSSVFITYPNGVTSGSDFFRMYLIKTDADGGIIWSKKYSRNDFDGASDVTENFTNSGYYLAAYAHQDGSVSTDDLIMRLDANGNILWSKSFGGTFSEGASDIEKTSDGNVIICGTSESFSNNQNIYVVKFDSSGSLIWSKTYGTTGFDYGKSILQSPLGGFFIYGNAGNGSPGYVALIKTDEAGNVLWSNTYGNSFGDAPEKLLYDLNGNLIALIAHYLSDYDGLILLIDTSGTTLENQSFGKTGPGKDDFITSVLPLSDGYLFAGSSNSFSGNQFFSDGYLVKTGQNLFSACNSDSLNSDPEPLALTVEDAATQIGEVTMGSYQMMVTQIDSDFMEDTLCSSVFTAVSTTPPLTDIVSIFPNPASDHVEIQSGTAIKKISITNIAGEEILTLRNPNTYDQIIPVSNLPDGMYLMIIDSGPGRNIRRFSVLR